jgi:hypothetical protein
MAREAAKQLGQPAEVLLFSDLAEVERYDGVWANACLLHVRRADYPDVLRRINRALKPGGRLYANFKSGDQDGVDQHGRYYNYPDEHWLRSAFEGGGYWENLHVEGVCGADGASTSWLHALAFRKSVE